MSCSLYIAMVGLPARGKSTVALRLLEGFGAAGIKAKIFNNGNIRREILGKASSMPDFYRPENEEGKKQREAIAIKNMTLAREFIASGGEVAILDATNASNSRRRLMEETLTNAPILYIECVNYDTELERACIENKALLPEFSHLTHKDAIVAFTERIAYYRSLYSPLETEQSYIKVDALRNCIIEEHISYLIPFHINIRDILVSEWVRDMFMVRHGQSEFNIEDRIGGNSPLTEKGRQQAIALADCFNDKHVPYIFTSCKLRSSQTALPILERHPEARCISLPEFDEIDAGICDSLRYEDIRRDMPEVYANRLSDKYHYAYPEGEAYATMKARVELGFRKALFLSGGQPGILLIGHQAVNRMILSFFLFRHTKDVPYIYVPQNQYFHVIATYQKKLFELVPFRQCNDRCKSE